MSDERPAALPDPFMVGRWWVEPRGSRIVNDGREVRLEPRVMHLLVCLAERPGDPITRATLMSRVWSDCVVGDDALNSAVAKLRRAIDRGPDSGVVVETVPKIGYRLIAEVARAAAAPAESRLLSPGIGSDEPPTAARSKADTPGPASSVETPLTNTRASRAGARRMRWGMAAALALVAAGAAWVGLAVFGARATTAAATMRVVPLTAFPGLEVEPALSPGPADRVAFAWRGTAQDNWDIYVQSVAGSEPLRLTTHPGADHYPVWSPDAARVAFARVDEGACELRTVLAMGGLERSVAGCPAREVNHLSWTPDGAALLVSARDATATPFRIFRVAIDSGARSPITSPPPDSIGDLAASISPDGHRLAVLHSPILGVDDLYVMSVGGDARTRVTHDDLKIHGFDWAHDSRALVFSSNRGGLFALWRVALDGRAPEPVAAGSDWLDAPSVGAEGRRIAYERWQSEANVYRLDLQSNDAQPERLLASTRWHWHADVSPDGSRMAVVSDRTGPPEIWLADARGDGARPLTAFGGPYLHAPRWSPDGRRVAFVGHAGARSDVYVIDAEAPEPRSVTNDGAEERSPAWSRNGQRIYYASRRSGAWEIWRRAVDRGEPERITTAGGIAAAESWDGRALYLVKPDASGIWARDLATGAERLIVRDLHPYDRDNWTVTRAAIYFVSRTRDLAPTLMRFDLASERIESIRPLDGLLIDSGLSVSPDGRYLVFTRVDRRDSDILLLESAQP